MERSLDSYEPLPDDIKDSVHRRIYGRVPLFPDEEQTIVAFRDYAAQNNTPLAPW